jgi:hypothetical protein
VKRSAVKFVDGTRVGLPEAGRLLDVRRATLKGWRRRARAGTLGPNRMGRPPVKPDAGALEQVRELVLEAGADVSVAYVRERVPGVPRAAVEALVREQKRRLRGGRRSHLAALRWDGAGRVWSFDWTDPPSPVEGRFGKVLAVRDLPSGEALQALPAEAGSGRVAAAALEGLFEAHGAPLVVKNDGGSELNGSEVGAVLRRYGVAHLCSPPYYPRYNGAIEAGIGALKTHAWHEAARHGRPGHLTCDDVEAARLKANETSRPSGPHGPSPDDLWASRTRITRTERRRFQKVLDQERRRQADGAAGARNERDRRADERHAVERALQSCGYLTVTRRRLATGVP